MKKRKMETSNKLITKEKEDKDKFRKGAIYRSNIVGLFSQIKRSSVTENHINACKNTPFYKLFKGLYKLDGNTQLKKSDEITKEIIRCYDAKTDGFKLGKKIVHMTEGDMKILFGIKCDVDDLPTISTTDFCSRYFDIKHKITLKVLSRAIDQAISENQLDDFARLLTLFTLTSVFFATKGDALQKQFIYAVEDLTRVTKYNWAKFITDYLMVSVRDNYDKDPKKVKGCTLGLLIWYYEHTTIVKPERENASPRCLKWRINLRPAYYKDDVIDQLDDAEVITSLAKDPESDNEENELNRITSKVGKEGEVIKGYGEEQSHDIEEEESVGEVKERRSKRRREVQQVVEDSLAIVSYRHSPAPNSNCESATSDEDVTEYKLVKRTTKHNDENVEALLKDNKKLKNENMCLKEEIKRLHEEISHLKKNEETCLKKLNEALNENKKLETCLKKLNEALNENKKLKKENGHLSRLQVDWQKIKLTNVIDDVHKEFRECANANQEEKEEEKNDDQEEER